MNTNERLDQIEARADKATPGKWKTWGMAVMADQDGTSNVDVAVTHYRDENRKPRTFDADFIASSRQDVPALVNALRAVLAVADMWAARSDSLHAAADDAPDEDITDALRDGAWDFTYRARDIRNAVESALGGPS